MLSIFKCILISEMLKCESVWIWKSVKSEFEDSKRLLKMRGIYHKRINIFATNILAVSAMRDPHLRERKQPDSKWQWEEAQNQRREESQHQCRDFGKRAVKRLEGSFCWQITPGSVCRCKNGLVGIIIFVIYKKHMGGIVLKILPFIPHNSAVRLALLFPFNR